MLVRSDQESLSTRIMRHKKRATRVPGSHIQSVGVRMICLFSEKYIIFPACDHEACSEHLFPKIQSSHVIIVSQNLVHACIEF